MLSPPSPNVFEILLLGRGLGEAVLLHMGDGNWIIIDCFQARDGRPAPLVMLEALGVSHDAVKLIVATHWHDDHVKGISKVYAATTEADFVLPCALVRDEFFAFVDGEPADDERPFSSGVQELISVLERRQTDKRRAPILTKAAETLYIRHASETSFGKRVELSALSPSHSDVVEFLNALKSGTSLHATRTPLPPRNHVSIASWAHFQDFSAILGADLERGSPGRGGWHAVLELRTLPEGKADYLKVPHHGSSNAHLDEIWADLLVPRPSAALAPWAKGGGHLPTNSDVNRLKSLTKELYTAKDRGLVSWRPDPSTLGKLVATNGATINSFPKDFGFVRFQRAVGDSSWVVSLGGGASAL